MFKHKCYGMHKSFLWNTCKEPHPQYTYQQQAVLPLKNKNLLKNQTNWLLPRHHIGPNLFRLTWKTADSYPRGLFHFSYFKVVFVEVPEVIKINVFTTDLFRTSHVQINVTFLYNWKLVEYKLNPLLNDHFPQQLWCHNSSVVKKHCDMLYWNIVKFPL